MTPESRLEDTILGNALEHLDATKNMRLHVDRLHAGAGNHRDIAKAEAHMRDGFAHANMNAKIAAARAEVRQADALEKISATLGELADKLTAALATAEDVDCTRCDGPIQLSTFQANDGLCEACKEYVDEKIDALAVSGPHEGEGRA